MSTTAADYRLDWILHEGDTIQTADATYTITGEPIGLGGSSVLYPASKSGSYLEYAIKECFPAKPAVYQRINGIIQTANPDDELNQAQVEKYREMLFNERKLGQEIRNTTTRAVSVWDELIPISITTDGKVFQKVSGGIFSVLERMDKKGRFFNELLTDIRNACPIEDRRTTFGLPSIQLTVQIMEQALLALQQVHNAGYYYGDLSGANVFFSECEPEKNHVGIGHLIDFGSTRKLESDGFTTQIIDGPIFSTDGFRPPEICNTDLFNENGFPVLSKQSDIFSMGCLMLRCVLSPAKIKTLGSSPCIGSNALSEVSGAAIGCTEKARRIVNSILDKSTQYRPRDRYVDAADMLADIHALMDQIRPPKNQLNLSFSSLAPGEFRGREEEIKAIDCRINERRKPIELYGFGGMGKSELAIEYCRRKMESNGIRVHFVRFDKTMRNTVVGPIADAFSGYSRFTEQGVPKSEQLIYYEVMKMLGEQGEDDILCIDNVDSEAEEYADLCGKEYTDLCRLKMNLIITTRFDRSEFGGIEVGALQRKHLHNLIAHILKDFPLALTENQMDDLIQAVDSHTLAVELIARTLKMNRPRLTPEALLEKLKAGDLGGTSFAKIASHKDRDLQKRRIEDHIKRLFQITNLPPDELSYMKNAILMDNRRGLPYDWFAEAQPNFDQDIMENLISRGWINLNRQTDLLRIHPLIHSISQKELGASIESSCTFLSRLWTIFEQYRFDGEKGSPIASLFATLPPILQKWIPNEWVDILCDWYDVSIDKLKLSISIKEQRISAYKAVLSKNYEDALTYITNAISIIEENPGVMKKADRGAIYHLAGFICIELKEYPYAFQYCQKSATTDNSAGQNDLAWLYLQGYGCTKNYTSSVEWFTKAALHPTRPVQNSNKHLGKLYLGVHPAALDYAPLDPEKALFHLQKAKELGATDVDELITKAYLMLDTTNP